MKTSFKRLLALAIALAFAAPVFAEGDDEGGEKSIPPQAKVIDETVQELGLNEEQQGKYQKIYEQHLPVLQKQYEQQEQIYTPEQKTKRDEAQVKAKEQKLKGKEYEQFVQSAVQFTPDQKKQYIDCETDIIKTQGKLREEVYQILTPAQQEKFPKFKGKEKVEIKGKGKDKPQLQVEPKQGKVEPKQGKVEPKEQPK